MSVINRVLKDLDRQGAAVFVPDGVHPIADQPSRTRSRRVWLFGVGMLLVAGLATWRLQSGPTPSAPIAVAAAVRPALPTGEALSPKQKPVAAVGPTADEPTRTPIEQTGEIRPHPAIQREAEPTRPVRPLAGRLETHLAEVGQPQTRVVKEARPSTSKEQAEDLFRQASRLVEQGRTREAQARLDETLRLDPGHAAARQTQTVLLMEAGESARAEALLKDSLGMQPNNPWYSRTLAQLYLQRGDTTQALAVLKAGLNRGVDAGYWGLYAAILNQLGRVEDTAQAYREATRLDPDHGPWWLGLAVALEQGEHKAEAAEAYRRALQTRLSAEVREFATQKTQELQ